jgi:hypothetical protein
VTLAEAEVTPVTEAVTAVPEAIVLTLAAKAAALTQAAKAAVLTVAAVLPQAVPLTEAQWR